MRKLLVALVLTCAVALSTSAGPGELPGVEPTPTPTPEGVAAPGEPEGASSGVVTVLVDGVLLIFSIL
jgi:hypothetical protein